MKSIFRPLPGILFLILSVLSIAATVERNQGLVDDVLKETNKYRKANRLGSLQLNEDLNSIAERHSENMAAKRVSFGHGGFNRRQREAERKISGLSSFAENVAYGAEGANEVIRMWKQSEGHRKNLLGRFRYVGIGIAKDKSGQIYYTEVFAN